MNGLQLVITITDRSRSEKFVSRYRASGVHMIAGALGYGTATSAVLDYLGLSATEKAVLVCLVTNAQAHRFVRDTARALWLDVPGNGIVLTVPVASIGSRTTYQFLTEDQPMEATEPKAKAPMTHELIVIITNQGNTDLVMDAARAAGAAGGTMLHAKGTGAELARKFFGVSLADEKELILIVAKKSDRDPIMKAVMHAAGMQTPAQSMVFSLPVSEISGLRALEEEDALPPPEPEAE